MAEGQRIAQEGGDVARSARQTMERRLGHSVISSQNASDYLEPAEQVDGHTLPPVEEEK